MPDSDFPLSELIIEKLHDRHELSSFECEDETLENFLKDQALAHQNQHIATTHVCLHNGKVIAFFTISNAELELTEKDEKKRLQELGKGYKKYPATLIARLAVSKGLTDKGIGTYLMNTVVGKILETNEKFSGSRFIITDSYPKAEKFYTKFGFKRIEPEKNYGQDDNIPMYVDIFKINLSKH